ncbi:IS630 family transposase [Bradyrhizobium sp. Leo121]|uniref:IS630 family transposase n=1 Tax=Bradyrhizobium sp. Leo121 TaxID=1571195 RepID=UPI001FDFE6C2|nr:IS630 family transposase [Bradyrhizobium sp. Leo121]
MIQDAGWAGGQHLMSRPLSNDLRERVVATPSATGSVAPGKMGGHRKPVLEPHRAFIKERISQTPHLTLHKLKDELAARGIKVSHNAVRIFYGAKGCGSKKHYSPLSRPAPTLHDASPLAVLAGRPGSQASRLHRRDLDQDQHGSATRWGPKGKRVPGSAPHGHWQTLTFLGALCCDGLIAPCVFDGPINGECFQAYVEQQLVSVLRPGDIVIMDHLGSHKSAALRRLIRGHGARLWYLPPYSPDLNPIDQPFAKVKHWMRIAQKRTLEDTWRHLGNLVATIQPRECSNYFANAGYASVKM